MKIQLSQWEGSDPIIRYKTVI